MSDQCPAIVVTKKSKQLLDPEVRCSFFHLTDFPWICFSPSPRRPKYQHGNSMCLCAVDHNCAWQSLKSSCCFPAAAYRWSGLIYYKFVWSRRWGNASSKYAKVCSAADMMFYFLWCLIRQGLFSFFFFWVVVIFCCFVFFLFLGLQHPTTSHCVRPLSRLGTTVAAYIIVCYLK